MSNLENLIAITVSLLGAGIFAIIAFGIWWTLHYIVVVIPSRKRQLDDSNQAQYFQVSNRSKLIWTLAAVVLLTLGTFFISIPFIVDLNPITSTEASMSSNFYWTWGSLSLVMAAWCVQIIWRMRYSISIDGKGIYSVPQNPPKSRLNWQEVGTIRNQPLVGGLKIIGRDGHKKVRLVYQLEDFDYLLTYVLQKVIDSGQPIELPKNFKDYNRHITVTELGCEIHNQPKVQVIRFDSIKSINIGKKFENDVFNHLRIWFITDTGAAIRLETYGNEVELFQTLYYAWSRAQPAMTA